MPTPLQSSRMAIEVVAIAGSNHFCKTVLVPQGQTLGWAANASGLYAQYPQLKEAKLGVWGKILPPETLVMPDDRLEVYLPINPAATQAHRARLRQTANAGKVRL